MKMTSDMILIICNIMWVIIILLMNLSWYKEFVKQNEDCLRCLMNIVQEWKKELKSLEKRIKELEDGQAI